MVCVRLHAALRGSTNHFNYVITKSLGWNYGCLQFSVAGERIFTGSSRTRDTAPWTIESRGDTSSSFFSEQGEVISLRRDTQTLLSQKIELVDSVDVRSTPRITSPCWRRIVCQEYSHQMSKQEMLFISCMCVNFPQWWSLWGRGSVPEWNVGRVKTEGISSLLEGQKTNKRSL